MSLHTRYFSSTPHGRLVAHIATIVALGWGTYLTLFADGIPFLSGVNLIFHEAGHLILFWAPPFLVALGGTLFEVGVPLVCAVAFYHSRAFLSMMCALWWVGYTMVGVSVYMGDARTQVLPLLGGDTVTHDWAYLFGEMGILAHDTLIAEAVWTLAITLMCYTIVHTFSHLFVVWQHRYHV